MLEANQKWGWEEMRQEKEDIKLSAERDNWWTNVEAENGKILNYTQNFITNKVQKKVVIEHKKRLNYF